MKTTSHLTRAVFRAIINNRPYSIPECRRRFQQFSPSTVVPLTSYTQRRTRMFGAIFGTLDRGFEGARNTPKNLELALERLVDFVRARRSHSRGPPDEQVLDAFRFLIFSRQDSQLRLTRNEVYLATEVFKYFKEKGVSENDIEKSSFTRSDLDAVLRTLALSSDREKFRSDTMALATMVYAAFPSNFETQSHTTTQTSLLLPTYVTILARTGSALDAQKLLEGSTERDTQHDVRVWLEILKGLANEGRTKEFNNILAEIHDRAQRVDTAVLEELVTFLADNNKFEEAIHAYEIQLTRAIEPSTHELTRLLDICVRTGNLQYAESISKELGAKLNENGVLEAMFVWAAAQNKDAESLKAELIKLLNMASPEIHSMAPFNHLVELAYSSGRKDIVAPVLEVAQYIGLEPDGKFLALQLGNAVRNGDLSDAKTIYEQMLTQDVASDNSDIIALNKFVAALAFSGDADYNLLMRVIDTLIERNADFDAEALAGVCRVLLLRDELEDLTGLLRHRVDFYPEVDRARISMVFEEFVLDPAVKDQRAFNAYDLFRTAFPETPPVRRLPIMQSFFDRKRPDLACLVFGHMRQREEPDARPDPDAYAKCFQGIAQCRDIDGLQMVFNMIKLDLEVELTTKVRNSLMLAYTACQMPYTAMIDHFWKIMDSREGPTYSTFEVALRACESWIPQGGYEARKIMAIVQAWNLEITKGLYDCYVGAIAGQSEFENVIELIEEMENEIGERPDVYTIGAFYNAIPWQYRKDEVEKWAKQRYPDLWEELESFGDEVDEEWEIRYFNIDRTIDIEDPPLFAENKYDAQISREAVSALEPPERSAEAENSML